MQYNKIIVVKGENRLGVPATATMILPENLTALLCVYLAHQLLTIIYVGNIKKSPAIF